MARIRIEKKKSGSILPWILGLLVLALAVWGVAELFEETSDNELVEEEIYEEETLPVATTAVDLGELASIDAYLEYTTDMQGEMGLDHEFSHRALTLLAAATADVADAHDADDIDARAKTQRVKQLADEITKDPYATDHADKIRMAALLITEVLEDVDGTYYEAANTSDLEQLRREAQDISAKTLTLNQKEDVRSFFGTAHRVLNSLRS